MRTACTSLILVFDFEITLLLLFYVIKAQLHPLSVSIHQCLLRLHMMIVGSWIYSYGSRFIALILCLLVGLATWGDVVFVGGVIDFAHGLKVGGGSLRLRGLAASSKDLVSFLFSS